MPGTHIPKVKKDPRPHRTAMESAVAGMVRRKLASMDDYRSGDPGELTLRQYRSRYLDPKTLLKEVKVAQAEDSARYNDIRTWTGAVWALRDREQRATDLKRAEYVARYRPFRSFNGDPLKDVHEFLMEHGRMPTWID